MFQFRVDKNVSCRVFERVQKRNDSVMTSRKLKYDS